MSEQHEPADQHDERAPRPALYEIRVQGRLSSERWSQWFDNLAVSNGDNGETVLYGEVADQAALYGLLARLRDLALPLVSVRRVQPPGE